MVLVPLVCPGGVAVAKETQLFRTCVPHLDLGRTSGLDKVVGNCLPFFSFISLSKPSKMLYWQRYASQGLPSWLSTHGLICSEVVWTNLALKCLLPGQKMHHGEYNLVLLNISN